MVDTGAHSHIVSPLGPQASPAMNDGVVVRMRNISLLDAELAAEFTKSRARLSSSAKELRRYPLRRGD